MSSVAKKSFNVGEKKSLLSEKQCRQLISQCSKPIEVRYPIEDAFTFIIQNQVVRDKIDHLVERVNPFNYPLHLERNRFYLNRYVGGGHRGWHCDGGITDYSEFDFRRLTVVVQLTPSDEYVDGDLEFILKPDFKVSRNVGDAVFFPAWEVHRLKEVTSGVRHSLIAPYSCYKPL